LLNDYRFHKIHALIDFKKWGVKMIHYGANNKSISFVVENMDNINVDNIIKFLHDKLLVS
jgi:hypothetical protein